MNILKTAVTPRLSLEVSGVAYTVEFPLKAVAIAEDKLGRTLRNPGAWYGIPAKDIPVLLEAGLSKHHPEMTPAAIEEICDALNPEAVTEVAAALGALAFPRWTAQYHKTVEELKAKGETAFPKA